MQEDQTNKPSVPAWHSRTIGIGFLLAPWIAIAYFVGFCFLWGRYHPDGGVWTWIKGVALSGMLGYVTALFFMRIWPITLLGLIPLYLKAFGYIGG